MTGINVTAIDLGTTTIAMSSYNMSDISSICHSYNDDNKNTTAAFMNPLIPYGADVISRMGSAMNGKGEEMKRILWEFIAERTDRSARHVLIGGNTAMIHILMGYDPASLTRAPFIPDVRPPQPFESEYIPGATIHIVPWASAFIGGDIIAGLYAIDRLIEENLSIDPDSENFDNMNKGSRTSANRLFIDLGTNGEMVLMKTSNKSGINDETLTDGLLNNNANRHTEFYATATAAGPAFEGGGLSCGVPGIPGAISHVRLYPVRHKLTTIDNLYPIGLCGSGAVSIAAELYRKGYVNKDASLTDKFPSDGIFLCDTQNTISGFNASDTSDTNCVQGTKNERALIFTADDLHEILLAKAAIAAGIKTLLKAAQLQPSDIDVLYLAGGFGYHISPDDCEILGMFPGIPAEKIIPAGNTCLQGLDILSDRCTENCTHNSLASLPQEADLYKSNDIMFPVPDMHIINLGNSDYFKKEYLMNVSF